MARRPFPATPGAGARRATRMVLATGLLGLTVAAAPLAAGAQEEPAATPTLSQVLRGEVDGLRAEAATRPIEEGDMGVVVEVTNDGDEPVEVAVPLDTLLVTEEEGDQTLAVTPPTTDDVVEVLAQGGTPTIEVASGTSTHELTAYCTELDDGYPYDGAAVTPIEPAHAVLAGTLRRSVVAEADHATTQEAVWWLTDEPVVPVAPEVEPLLDVDAAAFAAAPHRVTPDTGYVPLWMREEVAPSDGGSLQVPAYDEEEAAGILDESFEGPGGGSSGSDDGGVGTGLAVWVVLVGLVVATSVLVAARAGRGRPTPVAALVASMAPGWYPDPWLRGGHRYWDGRAWTTRVMAPPR